MTPEYQKRLRRLHTEPLVARVGRYLDEWSRTETGFGYPEDTDSLQWMIIDATNVIDAGPDPAAIRASLVDSAYIHGENPAWDDPDMRRRLAELAEMVSQ